MVLPAAQSAVVVHRDMAIVWEGRVLYLHPGCRESARGPTMERQEGRAGWRDIEVLPGHFVRSARGKRPHQNNIGLGLLVESPA